MSKEKLSKFNRILIKLSGEALMGDLAYGIDPSYIRRIADEIKTLVEMEFEVAIVIGGGNFFRGAGLADAGMDRITGDHIGMLATVINSLSLQDALEKIGVFCRVMSALKINEVCEDYLRRRAIRHLQKGRVVIFAAGTGNPFFTTDTAAALRAVEISADLMLKATKVDGIYSADPLINKDAIRYERLTYSQVLSDDLKVMDTTAIVMCRDHDIPLYIFNLNNEGDLIRAVSGENVGSIVERGE
jgi:uridylate kinase